jgi:histidine triad (HIT) family protein
MMSIFSKIVTGEIPCNKIAESEKFLAFLDVNPLAYGHVLVIPKEEINYLFDMDDDLYSGLMLFSKKVSKALKINVPCKRIGVAVIGLEVPHAHIHLIPLNDVGDINFSKPKLKFPQDQMIDLSEKIRSTYDSTYGTK